MNDFSHQINPVRLRVLHPVYDLKLFRQAWKWMESKPDWFKESMATWKMTEKEYFQNIHRPSQVDLGVFHHSKFVGLITFDEISPRVVEAHLDCEENTDSQIIVKAIQLATQHAFDSGVLIGVVWVQSFNRPILKIYEQVGFYPTNISIFRGKCKKRVVEWKQFVAKNPNQLK